MEDFNLDAIELKDIPEEKADKPNRFIVKSLKPQVKSLALNILSAVLFFVIALFCNLFLDGDFHYEQIFSWNMGLLVLVNWVCGIAISYLMRQSGINSAKLTPNFIKSEEIKGKRLAEIKNLSLAQRKLNYLIAKDFEDRRNELEATISNLIKHLMPDGVEWKFGNKLPKGTHLNVRKMHLQLKYMIPPSPSLSALAQREASYSSASPFDVQKEVDKTGFDWFIKKAGGKLGWFALAPIVLSIIASMLIYGEVSLGSITTVIGILAIMIFNAAKAYTTAYYDVSVLGVARNEQIVKIVDTVETAVISDKELKEYLIKPKAVCPTEEKKPIEEPKPQEEAAQPTEEIKPEISLSPAD